MKHKFVINGKIFTKKYISGVQRYTLEILSALDKLIDKDEIEICTPMSATNIPKYKNFKIVKYSKLREIPWEQIAFPHYLKKNHAISINLENVSPWIEPGIVCIHDINCVKNQKYYPIIFSLWYRLMFYNSIKRGKKIMTVSKFSKEEIEKWYKIKNVEVVCNSFEHINSIQEDKSILSKFNLKSGEYYFTL